MNYLLTGGKCKSVFLSLASESCVPSSHALIGTFFCCSLDNFLLFPWTGIFGSPRALPPLVWGLLRGFPWGLDGAPPWVFGLVGCDVAGGGSRGPDTLLVGTVVGLAGPVPPFSTGLSPPLVTGLSFPPLVNDLSPLVSGLSLPLDIGLSFPLAVGLSWMSRWDILDGRSDLSGGSCSVSVRFLRPGVQTGTFRVGPE